MKKTIKDLEDIIYNLDLDIKTLLNTLNDLNDTKKSLEKILLSLKNKDEK